MKVWMCCVIAAICAAPVWAQGGEVADEQEKLVAWTKAIAEFVGKERFSEADLKSFLEHYDSFNEFGDDEDEDQYFKDGKYRIDLMLEDEDYVKWAEARGLDRTKWLKKALRITAVVMKRQSAGQFDQYLKMVEQQLADLEKQRAELGDEMYNQMKQAFEAGAAVTRKMQEAFRQLPDASDEEAKLLEKYKKEMSRIMEDDEGCGDDEGWGDEEEDEEGCE